MTHDERPWRHARRDKDDETPGRDRIPVEDIRREFSEKMSRLRERWTKHGEKIYAAALENTRRSAPWLAEPPETAAG